MLSVIFSFNVETDQSLNQLETLGLFSWVRDTDSKQIWKLCIRKYCFQALALLPCNFSNKLAFTFEKCETWKAIKLVV